MAFHLLSPQGEERPEPPEEIPEFREEEVPRGKQGGRQSGGDQEAQKELARRTEEDKKIQASEMESEGEEITTNEKIQPSAKGDKE